MARRRASQTAKERDEERHTEINEEAMEYGQHDILTPGNKRDDGQSGVHRCGPAGGDWGKTAEPTGEQRGAKQGDKFARDVGKQGHRAKLGATVFGYENARKRIIAKARAYGETAGQAMAGEQEARQRHTGKRAEDGDKRQQQQTGTDATYAFKHAGVAPDAQADKEHKGTKGIKTDVTDVADKRRHDIEHADKRADNKEPDNDKTAFHLLDAYKNNGQQHEIRVKSNDRFGLNTYKQEVEDKCIAIKTPCHIGYDIIIYNYTKACAHTSPSTCVFILKKDFTRHSAPCHSGQSQDQSLYAEGGKTAYHTRIAANLNAQKEQKYPHQGGNDTRNKRHTPAAQKKANDDT